MLAKHVIVTVRSIYGSILFSVVAVNTITHEPLH